MQRTCVFIFGVLITLAVGTTIHAQPLVTGDLSVYYSFDELTEDGLWLDGSGNELHGLTVLGEFDDDLDDGLDDISLDTSDKVRGAGSAWFNTEPDFKDDYIAVCDPLYNPDHNDGCGEPLEDRPDYVPSTAFSFAAWVKVEETGTDQAIWQSRAGGGGFLHTQVQ
ncbi:MAG: hypothetical protein KDA87_25725, partial [Planctomycetales bacterium]|nr:hypothetical protein [Planctomycetales bacterium]